jgi:hypothetical protein
LDIIILAVGNLDVDILTVSILDVDKRRQRQKMPRRDRIMSSAGSNLVGN